MKFTDGLWHVRPGVEALYAQEVYEIDAHEDALTVLAPTKVIASRGDVLNRPTLTLTISSPSEGVIGVRAVHHKGRKSSPGFELIGNGDVDVDVQADAEEATLRSGALTARIRRGDPFRLDFLDEDGAVLTSAGNRSIAHMRLAPGAPVTTEPAGIGGVTETGLAAASAYTLAQLDLGVGELVYGLGERFGPLVKNGQTVDIWHSDGGTQTEMSYKSVPFYLTNRGYGVFVNQPEHVSFEVGSENVERVQFSTAGEAIEFFVIAGPTPADILRRYTALTGRAPAVPDWSYGLWLSTSFTTDYDEATVNGFIDGMAERGIPLAAFHFDCFWMREFEWSNLEWDARTFPDPQGMLARLHEKGLRVCTWINPYIAERSALFDEGVANGYLVTRADGTVWQWDWWVAGMGLVDFTNPAATAWFQGKLRELIRGGVDALKTDFGERIPTDVVWHDGTDPAVMHNLYTQLYNQAVFEVLTEEKGEGEAVLFARSATAGGQQFPVHWGGDNSSSYVSMAETLRGGLSLAFSGFGYWSHDIGGFEGLPDAGVFKRWVAFGALSSHTRLHGSTSYRVPWLFDDEAVEVTRRFVRLKLSLTPYLRASGDVVRAEGTPIMRPMQLAFPGDPAVDTLDRQYMLGHDLLVAPVFSEEGLVDFYLPAGTWTNFFTGETVAGGTWRREQHAFDSLPLYIREGAALPISAHDDTAEDVDLDGITFVLTPGAAGTEGTSEVRVRATGGDDVVFTVVRTATGAVVSGPGSFAVQAAGRERIASADGKATLTW